MLPGGSGGCWRRPWLCLGGGVEPAPDGFIPGMGGTAVSCTSWCQSNESGVSLSTFMINHLYLLFLDTEINPVLLEKLQEQRN